MSDLSKLLAQREEDFAAFQPPSLDEGVSAGVDDDQGTLDEIDYADDEEDEEDVELGGTKDEM